MTSTIRKHYPRRSLNGTFGTPVRDGGWRESDLDGQESARILDGLGAVRVYVNTFGVAYGWIDGVQVCCSSHNPVRVCLDGGTLVPRRFAGYPAPAFLRVEGGSF